MILWAGNYCNLKINKDQLSSIRNVTIAGLICNNYDLINIQKYPFLYAAKNETDTAVGSKTIYGEENRILPCESFMSQIDFNKWVEK